VPEMLWGVTRCPWQNFAAALTEVTEEDLQEEPTEKLNLVEIDGLVRTSVARSASTPACCVCAARNCSLHARQTLPKDLWSPP
jgi:hypothetical protein